MVEKTQKASSLATAVSRINQRIEQHDAHTSNADKSKRGQYKRDGRSHNQKEQRVQSSSIGGGGGAAAGVAPAVQETTPRPPGDDHHHGEEQTQPPIKSSLARAIEENKKNKDKKKCPQPSSGDKHNATNPGTDRRQMSTETDHFPKNTTSPVPRSGNKNKRHATTTRRNQKISTKSPGPIIQSEIPLDGSQTESEPSVKSSPISKQDNNSIMSNNHDTRHQTCSSAKNGKMSNSSSRRKTTTTTTTTTQNGKVINVNASKRLIGNALGRRMPIKTDSDSKKGVGKSELKKFTQKMDNLHFTKTGGHDQELQGKEQVSQQDKGIRNRTPKPRLVSKSEVPVGNIGLSQVVTNWADDSSEDDDDDDYDSS